MTWVVCSPIKVSAERNTGLGMEGERFFSKDIAQNGGQKQKDDGDETLKTGDAKCHAAAALWCGWNPFITEGQGRRYELDLGRDLIWHVFPDDESKTDGMGESSHTMPTNTTLEVF